MTISTIEIIKSRIQSASPESPIVIFRTPKGNGLLNAVFLTVHTQQEIKSHNRYYVGSFHDGMDPLEVDQALYCAAYQEG